MTFSRFAAALACAWSLALVPAAFASAEQPAFSVRVPKAAVAPKIDGTIDDPAWRGAARVELDWDFTFRRPSEESTEVYLVADQRFLYVAFVAAQSEPLTATQHGDDVPLPTDDAVNVYLWPNGLRGFKYTFAVSPIGTHYASSTENTAFAPRWESAGRTTSHGYVVSERIPLDVLRGDGRDTWLLQFDRTVRAANLVYEWSHDPSQLATDSPSYAGSAREMGFTAKTMRVKPRLQVYSLGQAGNADAGGNTSRVGADFAVPITATASFVGTLHPDYSNVELDQQTISPTVFPRELQEVRPFFTQGSQFYNTLTCHSCVDTPLLYTPAIPTPRTGYAVEGVQGRFRFGALDAISASRADTAQSVEWASADQRYFLIAQRQSADLPGVHDITSYYQAIVSNVHNFQAYVTQGNESGTGITTAGGGAYREYGVNLFTPKSALRVAYHDVGPQYGPIDGYDTINDVKGPTASAYREFDTSPTSFVQSIVVSQDVERYASHAGARNYTLDQSALTFNTRTSLALSLTSGENYILQNGQPGGYANQNGVALSYRANTSTPSSVSYNVGRFGDGFLRSWQRSVTLAAGRRGTLSLEADDTVDALDHGGKLTQWLERASLAYQLGPSSSLALGARRIVGTPPPFFDLPAFADQTNLSLAYYKRFANSELYVVYGDPNVLSTRHALIVKFIQYIGAQKGT